MYGYEIDKTKLKRKFKNVGSLFIMFGAILMPLILFGAVFYEPFKYLTIIPASLVIVSLGIIVFGKMR